jgi:hypothetical protein
MFAIGWDSPRLTSRESGPGLPSLSNLRLEAESLGKDMPAFSLRGFLTSAIIVLTLESTYFSLPTFPLLYLRMAVYSLLPVS